MIINEELFALEDQCQSLSNCIKKSETMKKYLKAKKVMEQSADVNLLIDDFSIKKEQFEKVVPYQKYAPEFREKQRALRLAKRQLDLHEKVADFRCKETHLQDLLDKIGQQLAETVSLSIKIDAGNPFFEQKGCRGCGGNCHE